MPALPPICGINFLECLKIVSRICRQAGYSGLICLFDETQYMLSALSITGVQKNLASIVNWVNQMQTNLDAPLGAVFSGTEEMFKDEKRGLLSSRALDSRIQGIVPADLNSNIWWLKPIGKHYIKDLFLKVLPLYKKAHSEMSFPSDERIVDYAMDKIFKPLGSDEFAVSRDAVRYFISVLDGLRSGKINLEQNEISLESSLPKPLPFCQDV
jgi:hypothetical protein